MTDQLQGLGNQAGQYFQSEDFKKLLPYLLSGGGGAALGAILTGRRRESSGEGRLGYLGRILGNAALAGGLAGGGHYLLGQGMDKATGGLTGPGSLSGAEDVNQGPVATAAKNMSFSPVTAGLAGLGGLVATEKLPGLGADLGGSHKALEDLAERTGKSTGYLRARTPQEISAMGLKGYNQKLRQRAGLPSANHSARVSTALREGLKTFGQTPGIRARRGAVGLVSAALPALIGSLLTSENT